MKIEANLYTTRKNTYWIMQLDYELFIESMELDFYIQKNSTKHQIITKSLIAQKRNKH
jgi:hypothetical protein